MIFTISKGRHIMQNEENKKEKCSYWIVVNGQDIEVDAATLLVSEKRVKRYIDKLKRLSFEKTGSLRGFWGDIIMFNVVTNKLLKTADPFKLERMLHPLKCKENTDGEKKS